MCVDKLIGVCLQFLTAFIIFLISAAVQTSAISPCVFHSPEKNVAGGVVEGIAYGILAVGCLGAIHRPARKQAR